jgi:Flp pilus assembly protein TadD
LGNRLIRAGQREVAVAEAKRKENSNVTVHQTLSRALDDVGRIEEAIAALREAPKLEPGNQRFQVRLSRLPDRVGDAEAAERLLHADHED